MSSFAANTHSNIKQVMRTALVGVAPADQLMLKGYLRVLLRLEADLEWVPANHPQVDLLFINEEFRSSDSVQRLLSNSPEKPILFVKRNQDGQGGLEGDTIIIPIKELSTLNRWLMQNISVLQPKGAKNSSAKPATQISQSQPVSSKNTNAENTQKNTFNSLATSKANEPKVSSAPDQTASLEDSKTKHLIDFAMLISQRPTGVYELIINNVRVGLADLKRQKLWLTQENVEFDNTWQLKPTTDSIPQGSSIDLFQWIWSKVWVTSKEIPSLISDNKTYQIRYWPKPSDKKNRTVLLRVFTALESKPQRVDDIAVLVDTSKTMVKKVLVGLLLSGGLQPQAYNDLNILEPNISSNFDSKATQIENGTANQTVVSTGSALDDALQRRASGQSAPVNSTVDINLGASSTNIDKTPSGSAPTQPQAPQKSEKTGFLSRLRKKLGL